MPKWTRDYLATLVLAAVAVVMALAFAVEWAGVSRLYRSNAAPLSVRTPGPEESEPEDGQDFELPGLDDYEQMIQRPLFMETRRPGEAVAEQPPPPPPQTPLNLKLMGVVATPKGKLALLADAKGKYKRLKKNDTLDGWTLVELGSDRVTMQQGDERKDLPLLKVKPKPPPGALGQPGQPGQPRQVPNAPARPPPQPPPADTGEIEQEFPEDETDFDATEEETEADEDGNGGGE